MESNSIREQFHRLIASGREGFVLDGDGNEVCPNAGFAVRMSKHDTLDDAMEKMTEEGQGVYLGWWKDPDDGREYINLIRIFEKLGQAQYAAYRTSQGHIYDFGSDTRIDCTHFFTETGEGESHG